MSTDCLIPSNPDISGIGVRIAIYLQNLLCFIPAVWAIWDGQVSDYELESAETHSTTNLVLAFAILISCIVQAITLGLTNYHASIVLSLSWMNNTNAFVYFLLYVQYRSQGGRKHWRWSDWLAHIKIQAKAVLCLPDGCDREGFHAAKEAARVLFKRIALLLGSLHLTLMAALGIWLWSSPQSFGSSEAATCVTQNASVAVFGGRVSFGSEELRIISLAMYSLFLVPGVNLLLPMVLFLSLHCWYHAPNCTETTLPLHSTEMSLLSVPSPDPPVSSSQSALNPQALPSAAAEDLGLRLRQVLPIYVGLGFLLMVNIIFIMDIELTLQRNAHLQVAGESEWGFGQILALLLVFMPLRDLVETLFRRRQEMQTKLDDALRKAINEKDLEEMSRWIRARADPNVKADNGITALEVSITHFTASENTDLIAVLFEAKTNFKQRLSDGYTALERLTREKNWNLVLGIAHVNNTFMGDRTALAMAFDARDWEGVRTFMNGLPANANTSFLDGQTQAPVAALDHPGWDDIYNLVGLEGNGNARFTGMSSVYNHLRMANIEQGFVHLDGRSALEVASCNGDWDGVRTLLEFGAEVNTVFSDGRSALEVASCNGDWDGVCTLVGSKASIDTVFSDSRSALEVASCNWDWDGVCTLVEFKADINTVFSDGSSILEMATWAHQWDIVQLLLTMGAVGGNRPTWFGMGETVLQLAYLLGAPNGVIELVPESSKGRNDIDIRRFACTTHDPACKSSRGNLLQRLLQHGLDPNLKDRSGETLLHSACKQGHASCVKLLLEYGADPNMANEGAWTPLHWACFSRDNAEECVQILLKYHADTSLVDLRGDTALHEACFVGSSGIVKVLLEHGVDGNVQNYLGDTPLHAACYEGKEGCVQLLLDKKADTTLQNQDGKTALQLAREMASQHGNGHETAEVFRRHGIRE